jgi:CheY-like chemotaxis protein
MPEGRMPGILEIEGIAEDMFSGKVLDSGYSDDADLFIVDIERKDGKPIEIFFDGETAEVMGWHMLNADVLNVKSGLQNQSLISFAEAAEIASEFVPDVILLDLNITDSHGVETYNSIIKLYANSAVVILSGMNDEDLALDIVKKGAQDYLLKSDVSSKILSKTIEYSKERKNLIGQLQMSELKYRNVFNQSPLPMFIVEQAERKIIQANQAAIFFYGYPCLSMQMV